jgi:hypothetical protein
MKYQYAVGRILAHFPNLKATDVMLRLRQSTYVSVPKRYLYFEVPKAGCTQMKHLLRLVEGAAPLKLFTDGDWQTRRDMFIHARSNVPLPSLVDLDNATQRQVLESPDFFRMTIVRNPYTRLISAWRNNVLLCERTGRKVYLQTKGHLPGIQDKSLVSFTEFVDYIASKCDLTNCDPHWMSQVAYTSFPAMNFSYVGKLEGIKEALGRFAQHLKLAEPIVGTGKNESLPVGHASYDRELADKVYSLYSQDFEAFEYDPQTWTTGQKDLQRLSNGNISISEEKLIDEIIERNLTILTLYEERERLQNNLRYVSRLGLVPAINSVAALHSISREGARKVKRWAVGVFNAPKQLVTNEPSGRE